MIDKKKSIHVQLAKLDGMNGKALAEKFEELYGFTPGETTPKHLRARLAFRIQEIFLGGIGEEDRAILEKAAASDPLSNFKAQLGTGRIPQLPGTQFRRVWKDKEYIVTVLGDGVYEYNNEKYTSLSRIAKVITGGHWNGKLFFGVK